MTKTNVMRLLDAAKIPYRAAEYEVDENDLNGMHAAGGMPMPSAACMPLRSFSSTVYFSARYGIFAASSRRITLVFVI